MVATATKALQDQLAGKDLPFLAEHLGEDVSLRGAQGPVELPLPASGWPRSARAPTSSRSTGSPPLAPERGAAPHPARGARSRRPATAPSSSFEPSPTGVGGGERVVQGVPGRGPLPQGRRVLRRAGPPGGRGGDVVVVNTHLYGLHLESGGRDPPRARRGGDRRGPPARGHDLVDLRHRARRVPVRQPGPVGAGASSTRRTWSTRSTRAASTSPRALAPHVGRRLKGRLEPEIADALALASERLERVAGRAGPDRRLDERRRGGPAAAGREDHRRGHRRGARTRSTAAGGSVAWVEGPDHAPMPAAGADRRGRRPAGDALGRRATAVLTSATIAPSLPVRLGLDGPNDTGVEIRPFDQLDVGSPFDYEANALLYCAAHLPDPRQAGYEAALARRAGGAHHARPRAARSRCSRAGGPWTPPLDALRRRLPWPRARPARPAEAGAGRARSRPRRTTCLFATMGFWQGIDVPGPSLSLVTIDRLPFPRPDEPLLQARRERARAERLPARRPAPRRHPAGPGRGPAHPHRHRPRRRRRPRLPPGHQPALPLGHRPRPAADAPHAATAPRSRRSSGRCASELHRVVSGPSQANETDFVQSCSVGGGKTVRKSRYAIVRAIRGRSYRLAKWGYHLRLRRHVTDPVVVFAMGKTGTTTLAHALRQAGCGPVFQVRQPRSLSASSRTNTVPSAVAQPDAVPHLGCAVAR